MQRVVYLSPFDNPGNLYIERQKALWREIGFEVQPFTLSTLAKPANFRGMFDQRNVIALHWLESRPFLDVKPGRYFHFKGLLAFLAYCIVLMSVRARTIQFIHNHHAHDAPAKVHRFSAWLTLLLGKIVDVRIVHDPASAQTFNATYLPHPLYRDIEPTVRQRNAAPQFGILGAIRPYKGIDRLLRVWPHASRLLIAGSARPHIAEELHALIGQRALQADVSCDFRFLSQTEFNAHLERIDVLILPHAADSILVSGAFFEAVGRVPAIIARKSSFSAWAQTQISGIHLFDDDASLIALIEHINRDWATCNSAPPDKRADELFGWQTCRNVYAQVFATA